MNVLYVGNYRDGTGYGQAAEDYILSLDSVGVNVVCKPLIFNNNKHIPHKRIIEIEKRSCANYDIVVQHTLPIHMQYDSRFSLNVALFSHETDSFVMSGWKEKINNMDICVVSNNDNLKSCIKSDVKIPTYVVHQARDFSIYNKNYKKLEEIINNTFSNDFIFYTIGEKTRRKNLTSLLKAYFLEFRENESVCLIVKTDDSEEEDFFKYCKSIASGLNIVNHPRVFLISKRLTDNDIFRLHSSCDAFVQCSYGEGWSIPAFDALGFGKTPIVTNCTGYKEYLDESVAWMVDCYKEPVFNTDRLDSGMMHGSEFWWTVDINELRKKMRECYSEQGQREERKEKSLDRAYEFCHEKIGENFLKVLKKCLQEKKSRHG